MNSGVKPQKQTVFITKSTTKQFLLTNSGVINSILGVSGLELLSSSIKPVNFFGAQSSLKGAQLSFEGETSSDLGGTALECPPPGRRVCFVPWSDVYVCGDINPRLLLDCVST